jgi:serine/threonine protein kinase
MSTHNLAPGTVLGRYELLMPIAQGGMATVWAARLKGSRGFSKTVAIKTILPSLSDDPQFEQMFLDEASIASKIQHPNVVQIHDLGEEDELLYLAMEWVDGESLSTLTKQTKKSDVEVPLRVALKIVAQAAAGLHAAHELRDDDDHLLELVHRDVSPQNILVSANGVVKIVDFGVAKALGRSGETSAGQLKGKIPYMSPEQAKGGDIDRRTDVFALGIMLYRLATGHHPFLDETDIKTMHNIIARPVQPPRTRRSDLPHELERVILKSLEKDPSVRYATAADLEREIEEVMDKVGGKVTVEEVATFVRATLGERHAKRRAALRDAALRMDELGLTTGLSRVGMPAPKESISSLVFTSMSAPPPSVGPRTQRGVGPEAIELQEGDILTRVAEQGDLPSIGAGDGDAVTRVASGADLLALPQARSADDQRISTPSDAPDGSRASLVPSSPSLRAISSIPPAPPKSNLGRNLGLAAAGLALVGTVVLFATGRIGPRSPPSSSTSTIHVVARPTHGPGVATAATSTDSALPTAPLPTAAMPSVDSAAASAVAPAGAVAPASAVAPAGAVAPASAMAPASASASALATASPRAKGSGSTPTPAPTTPATTTSKPAAKPPAGNGAVPAVQDPGF